VRATENATPPLGDVGLVQSGPFRYARNGVW